MMPFLHGLVRAVAESFDLPGPILEIGSYQVAGQEGITNLRPLFPGRAYLGVDMRPGPGVDQVADVEQLPLANNSVGTVLALSTFEHVPHFWRGFEEIERVLHPDGVLLVSCPFYFRIHNFPGDYWRFTPQALDLMLENYPNRILGWHGPRKRPINVWSVAFREERPAVSPSAFERYRQLLALYAHQPLSRSRAWRYRLGHWLCGRRPFAPYLEQNHWETECRTARREPAWGNWETACRTAQGEPAWGKCR
ncbi:MAG: class I SAM-dependent methyltransferase [Planctomycetes bacterium]|nr:class I SAM-dependent methyltransferase [Planctomycetota bacterium]